MCVGGGGRVGAVRVVSRKRVISLEVEDTLAEVEAGVKAVEHKTSNKNCLYQKRKESLSDV